MSRSSSILNTLGLLWGARHACTLPLPKAFFWRTFESEGAAGLPYVLMASAAMGVLLFATLPTVLGSAYLTALGPLWQLWTSQIAPWLVCLFIALKAAPAVASDLYHRHTDQGFEALHLLGHNPAVFPAVPFILAYATLAMCGTALALGASLLAGVLGIVVLGRQALAPALDTVLLTQNPVDYALSGLTAWVLALGAIAAVCVYSWPGRGAQTQRDSIRHSMQHLAVGSIRWALAGMVLAAVLIALLKYLLGF